MLEVETKKCYTKRSFIIHCETEVRNTKKADIGPLWLREFLDINGPDGHTRPVEGFLSWQHLTFVTVLFLLMLFCGIYFGRKHRGAEAKTHNRTLLVFALVADLTEFSKVLFLCWDHPRPWHCFFSYLPLFLCTMQMITVPLAALTRGRVREACLDFVAIFGPAAVFGLYAAGDFYSQFPVLSIHNVVGGITHAGIGAAAVYVLTARLASLKKRNVPILAALILLFAGIGYAANNLLGTNYMYLAHHAGSPYKIVYDLVGGNEVLYPVSVVALFFVYMALVYGICALVKRLHRHERRQDRT